MSTINVLGLVLLVLMLIVGGRQGWLSFLSLLVNFGLFFLALILVDFHVPPLAVTLGLSVCILAVTIFMGTNDLEVARAAFFAAFVIFICLLSLVDCWLCLCGLWAWIIRWAQSLTTEFLLLN